MSNIISFRLAICNSLVDVLTFFLVYPSLKSGIPGIWVTRARR
jgi:hypothetical protein